MGTSTRKPEEKEITPSDIAAFRVPNAAETGTESVVTVEGQYLTAPEISV